MTMDEMIDFGRVETRKKETPSGLPLLSSYRPENGQDALVIDAGSWQYRVGYSSKSLPALVFDPIVHRYQVATGETPHHQIGRIPPQGMSRSSSRTPYEEDGDVIIHSTSLEQILDYSFTKLNVCHREHRLEHPIFMTEVVANPPYCRREVSELLFEAYGAPQVAFGLDGLLAWHQICRIESELDYLPALVINIGNYHTTIFLLQSKPSSTSSSTSLPVLQDIKRISYGGQVATDQMLRLLQAKYPTTPSFPIKVAPWQAEEIVHRSAQVVKDSGGYDGFLRKVEANPPAHTITIQFPYVGGGTETLAERQWREAQREALAARRREQAQRLRERAERLRAEKINAKRQQVENMSLLLDQLSGPHNTKKVAVVATTTTTITTTNINSKSKKQKNTKSDNSDGDSERDGGEDGEELLLEDVEQEEEASALERLHLFGFENVEELQAALLTHQRELNKLTGGVEGEPEPIVAPDYSLLEIADSELTLDQIKEKKRQRLMKGAAEARERARQQKEEAERKKQEAEAAQEQQRNDDFMGWRSELYEERQAILTTLRERQRKRKEAMSGDRRAGAASARLRNVVSLVQDEDDEIDVNGGSSSKDGAKGGKKRTGPGAPSNLQGASTFGDEEEDWQIYRQISRGDDTQGSGGGEEEENEELNKRLAEVEGQLEQYDRDAFYDLLASEMQQSLTILDRLRSPPSDMTQEVDANALTHRMYVNVERYRVVEGLFQPAAILGKDQAGLIETIEYLLKPLNEEQQRRLALNVALVGSGSLVTGLIERLERELQSILPIGSKLRIKNLGSEDKTRLASWMGAANLCQEHGEEIPWITRQWYEEQGGERLPATAWFTNKF